MILICTSFFLWLLSVGDRHVEGGTKAERRMTGISTTVPGNIKILLE